MNKEIPSTKVIHSLDELLEYAEKLISKECELVPIQFTKNALTTSIRIVGTTWDEHIDARHARYIIELQKQIEHLFKELNIPVISDNKDALTDESISQIDSYVKIKVEKGSSILIQELTPILEPMVNKMTNEQVFFAVVLAIIGFTGCSFMSKITAYLAEKNKNENDLKLAELRNKENYEHTVTMRLSMEKLANAGKKTSNNYQTYEKPIKTLVSQLETEDTISIMERTPIPAEDAKKVANKQQSHIARRQEFCDGQYTLISKHYSQNGIVLWLRQDDIEIKTYTTSLMESNSKEYQAFLDLMAKEESKNTLFTLDLQMNVEYTRTDRTANIVGIGKPRQDKDNKRLSQLFYK